MRITTDRETPIESLNILRTIFVLIFPLLYPCFGVLADTKAKYLYLFGGFPDIRYQGGGMVHPHSEMNPATLELSREVDVSISGGISSGLNSILIKIIDKETSVVGGGMCIRCISRNFLCSGEKTLVISGELSYSFSVGDITVGTGTSLKWKGDNGLMDKIGKKGISVGLGTIASKKVKKMTLVLGMSSFLFHRGISGGGGIGLSNDDLFSFAQLFYIENRIIPAFGIIVRSLTWFRVFLSYHQDVTGGVAFISPRTYVWAGYSSYNKSVLLTLGLVF